MNERQWERQLRGFLNRAGEEIRRAGEDIKTEAQRLLEDVKDPDKHRKVRDGLKDLGGWAKKTAEELADLVEKGVRKAEETLSKGGKRDGSSRDRSSDDDDPTPVSAPSPEPRSAPRSAKTVGKRRSAKSGPKKAGAGAGTRSGPGSSKKSAEKKPLGRKPRTS